MLTQFVYLRDQSLALHLSAVNVRPEAASASHHRLPHLLGLVEDGVVRSDPGTGQPASQRVGGRQLTASPRFEAEKRLGE